LTIWYTAGAWDLASGRRRLVTVAEQVRRLLEINIHHDTRGKFARSSGGKAASPATKSPISAQAKAYVGDVSKGKISGADHPNVQQASQHLFGRQLSHSEIRSLACAPEVAHVTISSAGGSTLTVGMRMSETDVKAGYTTRNIGRSSAGTFMTNDHFYLADDAPRGTGTALFARQVDTAVALKMDHIGTLAAGSPGSKVQNGYYTWARLGFDATIGSPFSVNKLPGGAQTLNELMIRGGKDWWKANGTGFGGKFDLKEGSTSRRILSAYLEGG